MKIPERLLEAVIQRTDKAGNKNHNTTKKIVIGHHELFKTRANIMFLGGVSSSCSTNVLMAKEFKSKYSINNILKRLAQKVSHRVHRPIIV